MATSLHPTDGVRVLLELDGPDAGDSAEYRGALLLPDARIDYRVRLDAGGAAEILPADPVAHAALDARAPDLLRAIARTVARQAGRGTPRVWPRRVLRWRRFARD